MNACEVKQEDFVHRLPLIRQLVVDPDNQMCFVGLVPRFNTHALNLRVAVSQWQFFTIYPLLNIENSPVPPALPIPSKNLAALYCSIPIM